MSQIPKLVKVSFTRDYVKTEICEGLYKHVYTKMNEFETNETNISINFFKMWCRKLGYEYVDCAIVSHEQYAIIVE